MEMVCPVFKEIFGSARCIMFGKNPKRLEKE